MAKKKFIMINEGFICNNCGAENTPLKGGCRNHCVQCLYSMHVDKESPGDRDCDCHGLMKPTQVEYNRKKGFMLVHKCLKCKKIHNNKLAPDDSQETLRKVSSETE